MSLQRELGRAFVDIGIAGFAASSIIGTIEIPYFTLGHPGLTEAQRDEVASNLSMFTGHWGHDEILAATFNGALVSIVLMLVGAVMMRRGRH